MYSCRAKATWVISCPKKQVTSGATRLCRVLWYQTLPFFYYSFRVGKYHPEIIRGKKSYVKICILVFCKIDRSKEKRKGGRKKGKEKERKKKLQSVMSNHPPPLCNLNIYVCVYIYIGQVLYLFPRMNEPHYMYSCKKKKKKKKVGK